MEKPYEVIFLLLAFFALSNGGPREYHYFPELKEWAEAQNYCRENRLDPATIETEEEWSKVQQILENVNPDAWIGLYDDYTSWRWSLDGTFLYQDSKTPFGDWLTFDFDNWGGNEHCAVLSWQALSDSACSNLRIPLCYNEPTNSFVNSTAMTWFEAQSYCRLHYTDLASFRNQQEKDAIFATVAHSSYYWIGLSRESWKWSDQSAFSLKKWAPGEGVNTYQEEYCASAGVTGFIDEKCTMTKPFLCTVPEMNRNTYKVEIKTGSLNPDDPVAQESLLQHVESLFREHGIQNFTLSWRQQANGKLFNKKET